MSPTTLFILLITLSVIGYYLGRRRAYVVASYAPGIRNLHSRPTYYGGLVVVWCGIPALILFGFWLAFEDSVIIQIVIGSLPAELSELPDDRLNLFINNIKNLVSGNIVAGKVYPEMNLIGR